MTNLHDLLNKTLIGNFEDFMQSHSDMVLNTTYRVLRDRGDAEDATQLTFLRAWQYGDSFKGESKVTTWLHRIAVNEALQILRKRKKLPKVEKDDTSHIWFMDVAIDISKLPAFYRVPLELRVVSGFSAPEMAEMLDTTVPGIKKRLYSARRMLEA